MICYEYSVKIDSESEEEKFGSYWELCDYLNMKYGFDGVFTKDMMANYFKPRKNKNSKINPLIRSIYSIKRIRTNKAI